MADQTVAKPQRFFPQVITEAQQRMIDDIAKGFHWDPRVVRVKLWLHRRNTLAHLADSPESDVLKNYRIAETLLGLLKDTHEYALYRIASERAHQARKGRKAA